MTSAFARLVAIVIRLRRVARRAMRARLEMAAVLSGRKRPRTFTDSWGTFNDYFPLLDHGYITSVGQGTHPRHLLLHSIKHNRLRDRRRRSNQPGD